MACVPANQGACALAGPPGDRLDFRQRSRAGRVKVGVCRRFSFPNSSPGRSRVRASFGIGARHRWHRSAPPIGTDGAGDGKMLGEFGFFKGIVAVVGMMPAWRPRVVQGGLSLPPLCIEATAVETDGAPNDAADPPDDATPPPMSRDDAVDAFFAAWFNAAPHEPIAFHWVRHGYANLATSRGWPPISDKALSQALVARGCRRFKVDLRRRDQGRVSMIEFRQPSRKRSASC